MKLLEMLRSKINELDALISKSKVCMADTRLDMDTYGATCTLCGVRMIVQKTVTRKAVTLLHNRFQAREWVLVCPKGCRNPNGTRAAMRDRNLALLLPAGSNYGYDIEVFVGIERYVRFRQREEIRSALFEHYGISISSGEVSVLARRFLRHIEALHKCRAGKIRDAFDRDGGYTMHIDATTEDGKGTLFVILSGWRQWALGAWKIPSESAKVIEPHIMEMCGLFGEPCAIIRDLGQSMATAADQAAAKMSVHPKIRACHYHFLCDIGKDILGYDYDCLRKLARKFSVRVNIRSVITSIRKKTDAWHIAYVKKHFSSMNNDSGYPTIPGMGYGYAFVIVLAQWILDYAHDSNNQGFPFDRPYFDLYRRCLAVSKAIDVFLAQYRFDCHVDKAIECLKMSFLPFLNDKDVHKTVRALEARMGLFDKFRALFRLDSEFPDSMKPERNHGSGITSELTDDKLVLAYERFESDMRRKVEDFSSGLKRRFESSNTRNDMKRAAKIIIEHLERHGKFLWGHLIALRAGEKIFYRMTGRTNNILENFFHKMKHRERRRSGHKVLTRDFECIPPAATLAMNLVDPDYVKIICGSLDALPRLFADIDHDCLLAAINKPDEPLLDDFDDDMADISMSDKLFVRKNMVSDWIIAASEERNIENQRSLMPSTLAPFEDMNNFLDRVLP